MCGCHCSRTTTLKCQACGAGDASQAAAGDTKPFLCARMPLNCGRSGVYLHDLTNIRPTSSGLSWRRLPQRRLSGADWDSAMQYTRLLTQRAALAKPPNLRSSWQRGCVPPYRAAVGPGNAPCPRGKPQCTGGTQVRCGCPLSTPLTYRGYEVTNTGLAARVLEQ